MQNDYYFEIMKKTIQINGKEYQVDIDKAIKDGYLREKPCFSLAIGDVYVLKDDRDRPVLLIQTEFQEDSYSLIGFSGLDLYSDAPTSCPIEEIKEWLISRNRIFSHNINDKVQTLMLNPAAKVV